MTESLTPHTDKPRAAIVVTDLDGTLLDHHSYDWKPAEGALRLLQNKNIPVVFNTSKTYEESQCLQADMGLKGPLIVENGSCIHNAGHSMVLGASRDDIQLWLQNSGVGQRYQFASFSELGRNGVVCETGLSPRGATQALRRKWSEPLLWKDQPEAINTFRNEARDAGLNVLVGGRFVHVLGDCDKGRAAKALMAQYTAVGGTPALVALGDSPNDLAMLEVADYAIWIRSPNRDQPLDNREPAGSWVTHDPGPTGWAEAINQLDNQGVFNE